VGDGERLELPAVRLRGPIPFVGRAAQLSELQRLLAGPPTVVILEGEAGIGKTRLLRRVLADLTGPVLFGEYDDVPEPRPLSAILDAVRDGAAALPPPEHLDPVIGALAPLLPDLADRLPPAPAALENAPAERHRSFLALGAVFRALGPAILVLEDVHWADPAGAGFLVHLAEHPIPGLPVLATRRVATPAGTTAAGTAIHEALARAPVGSIVRLGVPPLDADDVRELTRRTLSLPDPPSRLTTTLLEHSAGIPFVVEEVLRALAERGGDPLTDIGVPYLLRDVVLMRLNTLTDATTDVLAAAAVAGMVPLVRQLAAVLDRDEPSVAAALAEAGRAGLLHDDGDGPAFRHELARRAVYDLLPAATRQLLHRNTARVLEARVPRPVAVLAHHYRLAGSNADFVRNAEAAADLATRQGDDVTAAGFLLQTMDVAELPRPVRLRLAGKLGRSAIEGLSHASAVPVLERLLADRRLPPGARGDLGLVLGRLLRQQGEALRGYTEIERALPFIRSDARRAQALAVLAAPDTVVGRHVRQHLEYCREAERAAERSTDPGAHLAVRIARASLLIELGDPLAWSVIDELRASPALADRPREHARACLNWAQGALHSGHLNRAEALADAGRRLVEESGYERLLTMADVTDLSLDRALGRFDGRERRLLLLLEQAPRFPVIRLDAVLELALVRTAFGRIDAGRDELLTVVADAERVGAVWPLIRAHSAMARVLIPSAPEQAAVHAEQALDLVRAKGIWSWAADAVLALAEMADSAAGAARAQQALAELAAGIEGRDAPAALDTWRRSREILGTTT